MLGKEGRRQRFCSPGHARAAGTVRGELGWSVPLAVMSGVERDTHLCLLTFPEIRPFETGEDILCVVCMSGYCILDVLTDALSDAILLFLNSIHTVSYACRTWVEQRGRTLKLKSGSMTCAMRLSRNAWCVPASEKRARVLRSDTTKETTKRRRTSLYVVRDLRPRHPGRADLHAVVDKCV